MNREKFYRQLPGVDELLRAPELAASIKKYPRTVVLEAARTVLADLREAISRLDEDKLVGREFSLKKIAPVVVSIAEAAVKPDLVPVINATGVILHTNLGRANLAKEAAQAVFEIAVNYSNLEYDLEQGERGSRHDHVRALLKILSGAETAAVVNNNAAAVLLALKALARSREVIISRGELIEIGGSFRIPAIMEESQAILREVGTTNKTHLQDYQQAINEETALLLKVHTSNYRVVGFTAEVEIKELAEVGRAKNIPLMVDLGSGVLIDLSKHRLAAEPTVAETVAAGADIVTFSGDKLLGGPQAGIIVGKKEYIDKILKDPLARALRIDKLSLAALEATLRLALDEDRPDKIPVLAMLLAQEKSLKQRAEVLSEALSKKLSKKITIEVVKEFSKVGGGALPLAKLPTYCVAIVSDDISVSELATRMRTGSPVVIARVQADRVLLDVRTLKDEQLPDVVKTVSDSIENG
ncbi:MAG TPA: L-seryl-tRNA(Sec) selenium transferase [Actinobacteria bacterium]|nr:L-seryl-tRNA(Sec) selenium transferase [Actinomycetes bacterium]HEX21512.1 L-seryl-tRNA(Sec) selenium transferase [Actinomycetota bacterium]